MEELAVDIYNWIVSTPFSLNLCLLALFAATSMPLALWKLSKIFKPKKPSFFDLPDTIAKHDEIRRKYGVTKKGFLPESCLERLPEYYEEWERIADKLPELNKTGKLQTVINNMKLLSCKHLENEAMIRRAFIILAMMVQSYAHGSAVPWEFLLHRDCSIEDKSTCVESKEEKKDRKIPHQLAIPWCTVCRKLDLPYIITAVIDLWNWKLKNPERPFSLHNLRTISSMTGTSTEVHFHSIPSAMQAVAGPFLPKLFTFHDMIKHGNQNDLVNFISDLTSIFKEFKSLLSENLKLVDKDVFWFVYRPLLGGFWPDGILLEMCSDQNSSMNKNEKCDTICKDNHDCDEVGQDGSLLKTCGGNMKCDNVILSRLPNGDIIVNPKGISAGQSTMIVLFDLLLGIEHVGCGKEFQDEMVNYMPYYHRQMIIDFKDHVKRYGSLRDVIINLKKLDAADAIIKAFNDCINASVAFRASHLGIVMKYLSRTNVGTGSSSFKVLLDQMMQSTKKALIH